MIFSLINSIYIHDFPFCEVEFAEIPMFVQRAAVSETVTLPGVKASDSVLAHLVFRPKGGPGKALRSNGRGGRGTVFRILCRAFGEMLSILFHYQNRYAATITPFFRIE